LIILRVMTLVKPLGLIETRRYIRDAFSLWRTAAEVSLLVKWQPPARLNNRRNKRGAMVNAEYQRNGEVMERRGREGLLERCRRGM
jgi:hypothetical protein